MKWPVVALLVSGIAAAVCAALLVAALGVGERKKVGAGGAVPREIKVLVAKRDVPTLSVVDAESFEEKTVQSDKVPAGAISDPMKALGEMVTSPVVAGEVLTRKHLAPDVQGKEIAARLPAGMRAMSVSLANYASLEHLLYPGSRVDVIATFSLRGAGEDSKALSTTLLQNVAVLAIEAETVRPEEEEKKTTAAATAVATTGARDRSATSTSRSRARKVTLMVDPKQAEALQLAVEYGTISLAMRNPHDKETVDEDSTVLSAGRLARLAEFLHANVDGQSEAEATANGELAATAFATSFPPEPRALADWEVAVFRGVKVDRLKFPTPERDGAVASPK